MDKISQLMDGELGRRESETQVSRLESDQALQASWETYHLIGDTLRHEAGLTPDFTRRLHQRLGQEPTVIAPHMRLSRRAMRYTLPLAAGVAGVTFVAGLALSFQQAGQQPSPMVAGLPSTPPAASVTPAGTPGPGRPNAGVMSDYLTAHQEFSPSTAMHGVASYVRTVSTDESIAR